MESAVVAGAKPRERLHIEKIKEILCISSVRFRFMVIHLSYDNKFRFKL